MRNHITFLTIFSAFIFFACVGCGNEPDSDTTSTTTATAEPVTPAPTTPTEKPVIVIENDQPYVNTVTLAGITLQVTVRGAIAPNSKLDINLVQTTGGHAAAIRLWVGDESGIGSLKTKTHSHGAESHAEIRSPATLPANSAVWIEVQTPSGEKESRIIVPKQ
jgi:hypothetical protein